MIAIESELRALSATASTDITASNELSANVLRRAQKGRRRRVAGISIAAAVALVGTLGATRLGVGPYFTEVQPSQAMYPTIERDDVVTFDRDVTAVSGDVVRLELPTTQTPSISRVIAMAGQTVGCPAEPDGTCAGVRVDGVLLSDPYLASLVTAPFPDVAIPARQIFVMGDNRDLAMDSRIVGPVAADKVEAVAVAVRRGDQLERIAGAPEHRVPGDSDPVDPPGPLPGSSTSE